MQAGNKYVCDHPDEAGIICWWKKGRIITPDEKKWPSWCSTEALCAVLLSITSSRWKMIQFVRVGHFLPVDVGRRRADQFYCILFWAFINDLILFYWGYEACGAKNKNTVSMGSSALFLAAGSSVFSNKALITSVYTTCLRPNGYNKVSG